MHHPEPAILLALLPWTVTIIDDGGLAQEARRERKRGVLAPQNVNDSPGRDRKGITHDDDSLVPISQFHLEPVIILAMIHPIALAVSPAFDVAMT